ncbi:MAG: hypothetical protein COA38_20405 [Fluviicola sp.]|nr:MAG: hypothetical protein COA38_20405 [Fluviicola sp.]
MVTRHGTVHDMYSYRRPSVAGKLKKLTQGNVDDAVAMYRRGVSCGPIAEYFGVSRNSMHGVLKRRVVMRPQKRYGKDNHFYRGGPRADDPVHNLVEKAVASGALVRSVLCEECCGVGIQYRDGRASIQAHHDDYNKPLDVRWLCKMCHHKWHEHNTAVARV